MIIRAGKLDGLLTKADKWAAVSGICYLCGNPVLYREVSWDHVRPVSLGGGGKPFNKLPTHATCNNARNNDRLTPEQDERCTYQRLMLVASALCSFP